MTRLLRNTFRLLPVLLLCGSLTAFSQERAVSGRVTASDDNSALPGVNILEKGTSNGTVTDSDGNFRISVGSNATLIFSFVGYTTQEVAVGAQSTINVALAPDVTALSEIVVVGYGSQEKKEVTSAVVTLKTESFNKGNINDPSQLLQGKIAGVSVSKPGSDPTEGFAVRLRGVTSVGQTSPLYVIDGVIGASIQSVDPNDIASIDVLKDGSAAAIYGTRGSAGVILITTKKGKSGKTSVDVNSYLAIDQIAKKVPVLSGSAWKQLPGAIDKGSDTDWLSQVTQTGVTKVTNLGVSGGQGNTSYRFSLNYRDVEGILKNNGLNSVNARFSLQQSALNNKLRLSFDLANTSRKSNYSFQEALRYAAIYNPTSPVYDASGANPTTGSPYTESVLFDNFNPVAIINQNINEGRRNIINLSAKAEYDFLPGLTGVVTYALQRESELTGQYYSKTSYFRGWNRNGLAYRNDNQASFQVLETYLNYNKQVNDLNVQATAGYSYSVRNSEGFGAQAGNFLSDALGYNQLGNSQDLVLPTSGNNARKASPVMTSYASSDQLVVGFFGRANLNFKETYLLSGSIRHEGSNMFGKDNKWGDFYAGSGAVVLSNLFSIPMVNSLKARVGYGLTGALPPTYGASQLQFVQSNNFNYANGVLIPVATTNIAPNPNLKWETKGEVNLGLDFGMFNNKLTGTIDLYDKTAKDFIMLRPVDASQNVASQEYLNVGKIETKGVEVSLTYNVIQTGDFSWSTTVIGSTRKSILKSLFAGVETSAGLPELNAGMGAPGQNNTYPISNIAGQQVGTIYGPKFTGTVDASGSPLMESADGTPKLFKDLDRAKDYHILGHGLPQAELGWSNALTYKSWDFNVFFRSSLGHSLVNSWRAFYEPIVPGQINSYNRVDTKYSRSDIKDAQFSSYYVEKANFLKLDNATLGYNFKVNPSSGISRLRLYVSGNNLFVITNYTGVDPEARLEDKASSDNGGFTSSTANPLAPGIDRRSNYFRARTFTFGVNLTF
ncbi:MAG: SusC/RagA family TonB-linked outer membrane protein [Cyclobacteriaceae bacterium]